MRLSATTLESECSQAERDLLLGVLRQNSFKARHLEIGTAAGGTLKEMMGVYRDRDDKPGFVVIDPLTYFENQREKVEINLRSADIDPAGVEFWIGKTQDFIEEARASQLKFDFIFIDAVHKHVPVMIDLQWADLLHSGGYICFHDYGPKFPGVIWAADYFLKKNKNFVRVGQAGTLLVVHKTAEGRNPAVTRLDIWKAAAAKRIHKLTRPILKISTRLLSPAA